ncbi:MAG: hypothetical protein FJY34_03920 [Betaproteobacteria bacterium]|nr:hypothetical protein [Betaproteobacteria bacterium]
MELNEANPVSVPIRSRNFQPLAGGIVAGFLDPNDAAVSKYARGEPRDREWIRAGHREPLPGYGISRRCRTPAGAPAAGGGSGLAGPCLNIP